MVAPKLIRAIFSSRDVKIIDPQGEYFGEDLVEEQFSRAKPGFLSPRGYDALANLTTSQASSRLLGWLYEGIPLPKALQHNQTQPKRTRNEEIRERDATGETLIAIAKDYGISKQRVHQIIIGELSTPFSCQMHGTCRSGKTMRSDGVFLSNR